jgi:aspartyl-tRNA(Asn)/glutamyl-tRNA(Gln) amidotransferase subunit A
VVLEGRQIHVQPVMNRYTPLFNLTGQPALSLPCGMTSTGLPIGCQLAGRPLDEPTLLRVARAIERATDWHTARPSLAEIQRRPETRQAGRAHP